MWSYPVLKKKLTSLGLSTSNVESAASFATDTISIDDYLDEFDVKDITCKGSVDFDYSPILESNLPYNVINGFKVASAEQRRQMVSEEAKELISKLE